MARRRKGLFARIGEAFSEFWRTLSEPEPDARPEPQRNKDHSVERARRPLPPRPFGVPEPAKREPKPAPEEPRNGPVFDWDNANATYPEHWGPLERQLWNSEPQTYRDAYTDQEYTQLQEAFEHGWLTTRNHSNKDFRENISKDEREAWRERFYDITGVVAGSFDWSGFREYLIEVGSPTIT